MARISSQPGAEMLSYLSDVCLQNKIVAVGEEMSVEVLSDYESLESVPMHLAKKLNLQHYFCDPSPTERVNLKIQQDNDIKIHGFINNLPEEEISNLIKAEYAKREAYWLNQLQLFNKWPLLFICGAKHVESFASLLINNGIKVEVAAKDWEPIK